MVGYSSKRYTKRVNPRTSEHAICKNLKIVIMQQKGKKLSCRKLRPGPLFVSEMTNSLPSYENNGGVHVHVEEAAAAGRLHCEMIAVLQQRRP
jgi:hypothetical protein